MDVWNYPTTWRVGDVLSADNLNTRLRDQNNLLLRRPLTFATMSVSQNMPTASNTTLGWDTIVQDDDGMVVGDAATTTTFYAQRYGAYRFWCGIAITTTAAIQVVALTTQINNTTYFQNFNRMEARSGLPYMLNDTGIVTMSPGETFQMLAWNGLATSALTIPAFNNNVPYIAIMWLGAS